MCQAAAIEVEEPIGAPQEVSATAPPAAPLGRLEVLRAMRVWLWESPMSSSQGALTSGTFQTGYALFLGCNSFLLGVLAAIPPLVSLLQLVSSYFAHLVASRRRIVGIGSVSGRLVWIGILAIPWIFPRSMWVGVFVILSLLSNGLLSITNPLWMDWISDIVPPGKRGWYFGRRNVYGGLTAMVVSVGGGVFLDASVNKYHWSQTQAFALLFGLACAFAVASFTCCMSSPDISERPKDSHPAVSLKHALETYLAPIRDLAYRKVILMSLAVVGVLTFAGNFYTAYQLQPLHLSYAVVQILGIASSVAALLAMPFWGYLADKFGNKPVLILSTLLVLPTSAMWCFVLPDSYPGLYSVTSDGQVLISGSKLMILTINFMSAIGWSGVGMAQFNLTIGAAPRESRSAYITTGTVLAGIVGAVSPLLGGLLMQSLSHVSFPDHGLVRSNYDVLFVVSSLMRFMILGSAIAITESESRSARYVLGQLSAGNPIGAAGAMQKLSRSSDSAGRVRAAATLGRMKAPIAVEELVRALDDAALPVREKAAEALGEIGDSRAVYPLLDKLKDTASGISTEAAAALGKIGDHSALPELLAAARDDLGLTARRSAAIEALGMLTQPQVHDYLAEFVMHPFPSLRISALRALSMRPDIAGSPTVRRAVLERWRVEDDPSALPLLADAISQLGDPSLAVDLAEGLDRANSPVTRRELLNAIGSLLGGRDSFYAYLALDRFAADDTISKILISLQRRLRPSRGAPDARYAARFVVRIRQALTAFAAGQLQLCARRLGQAGQLETQIAARRSDLRIDEASLAVLRILAERSQEAELGHEELLLMVFIVRLLAVG